MGKNLLADTDFTDSRDTRFVHSVVIGKVSKIECNEKGANIRVIMPDKIDHTGQPLITKPVPVLQVSAGGKRSFAMPRVGQNAIMIKLPNSTSSYVSIAHFYTSKEPPPVTDPKLDYCEYDDGGKDSNGQQQQGSIIKFDANEGADPSLTWNFKGGIHQTVPKDYNINTSNGAKFNVQADGDIINESKSGNLNFKSDGGTITIEASTIYLKGTVTHTGNMSTTGIHTASDGPHSSCGLADRDSALDKRLAAIEARLAALDGQPAPEQPPSEKGGCC